MDNKYSIKVAWSEEDSCFVGLIPEFPLLSAFGDSQTEAFREVEIVLEMALETSNEDSMRLPSPVFIENYSGQLRLRLPKSLHRQLSEAAADDNVSLNSYLISLLSGQQNQKQAFEQSAIKNEQLTSQLDRIITDQSQRLQSYRKSYQQLPTQDNSADASWYSAQEVLSNRPLSTDQ